MGTSTSVWQPTDDYMIQFASCRFQLNTDLPTQIYHQTPLARMHVAVLCAPRDYFPARRRMRGWLCGGTRGECGVRGVRDGWGYDGRAWGPTGVYLGTRVRRGFLECLGARESSVWKVSHVSRRVGSRLECVESFVPARVTHGV